jgi:hypothetical protein
VIFVAFYAWYHEFDGLTLQYFLFAAESIPEMDVNFFTSLHIKHLSRVYLEL